MVNTPQLVKDIFPGTVSSLPNGFTVFNNALYFQADDGTNGNELWRVDGSGTAALVRDIIPGIGSSNPEGFTVFNNALYFQANDFTNGDELWRVDSSGTAALVSNINPALGGGSFAGGSSFPRGFTVFNNALYFTANDGTNGNELWKLDTSGTAALVRVINPSIFGGPNSLTVFNNALYFQVDDGTTGIELWKLDSSGTVAQVSDINPGFRSSDPFNFTVFNNALYFAASDGTNGRELWRVDSLGGVAQVSDINPGSGSSFPNRFTVFNNALYFYASDGTTGFELWKVDSSGTAALVRDINPGSGSSNPFAATDPNNALVFNNALYFSAKDGTNGTELWKVDSSGTAALVRDITPGSGSSDLRHFTVFNNSLYFSTGLELWKVDSSGTAALVSNINSDGTFVEEDFTEFNNALYFQASRGGGRELWRFSDDPIPTPEPIPTPTPEPIPTPTPAPIPTPTPEPIPTPTPAPIPTPTPAPIPTPTPAPIPTPTPAPIPTPTPAPIPTPTPAPIPTPTPAPIPTPTPAPIPTPTPEPIPTPTPEPIPTPTPKLRVSLVESKSSFVNELAVFTVDDAAGTINGLALGSEGYAQAALDRARSIFSTIANIPKGFDISSLSSFVEFDTASSLRFMLVKNSTLDNVKKGITPISNLLLSDLSLQQIADLADSSFSLAWKDSYGNTTDFKDLVLKIEGTTDTLPLGTAIQSASGIELIDLRNAVTSSETVKAEFSVYREAAFNNYVGFYKIDDTDGSITDPLTGNVLKPGDSGYTQTTVGNRVAGIDLEVANQSIGTLSGELTSGSLFAPFIIIDASPTEVLDTNTQNDPAVYFAFLGANADRVDHIRLLANNVFGFEDIPNGGDLDYNDMVIAANFKVV